MTEPDRAPRTLTDEPRCKPPPWVRAAFVVMILLKLVLVSHEEVLPYGNDDSGFAQAAAQYYWQSGYTQYNYVKPPVYPLFVSGTTVLGIPTRLAQEGLWCLACMALGAAVWRAGLGGAAAVVAGGLAIFHPWSINIMNRLLMDSLYAPLYTFFIAAAAIGLVATSRRELRHWGAMAAVMGALAATVRPESVLVYGVAAGAAGLALLAWRLGLSDRRLALWRLGAVGVAPAAAAVVLSQAICAANYSRIGVWCGYDLGMPGFTSLYRALLAIPPGEPNLDIPIPREVRERAYAASPTFARLRPWLDGDDPRREFLEAYRRHAGVNGEYGAWIIWALRDAAWRMEDYEWKSARDLDALYRAAADELRGAMERGELESRWAPLAHVPPEWGLMARAAPGSLAESLRMLMTPRYIRDRTREAEGWYLLNYDAVANRRATVSKIAAGEKPGGSTWHRPGNVEAADRAKGRIGAAVGVAMRAGAALGGLGLLLSLVVIRRGWLGWGFYSLAGLLVAAVAARLALVVLLDMNGVYVQWRYLLPGVPLVIALEIAGVAALGRVVAGALGEWRGRARVGGTVST